jgi:hypothetical protein
MSLLNFDKPTAGSIIAQEYGYSQGVTLTAGAGIGGTYSYRTTAAMSGGLNNGLYEGFASLNRTGTKGIWSNFSVAGSSGSAVIAVWQGDSFLEIRPNGNDLDIWTVNSGGVIATAAAVITPGTFARVDLTWTVSSLDATNNLNYDGHFELKVDLVTVALFNNIQLGFAIPLGYIRDVQWNVVVFNPHGDGDKHYLTDASGSNNTGYLPDNVNIYTVLASTGNGTYAEMVPSTGTDHGALVDEATSDDDTTYLAVTGAAKKDTFNFANFSSIGSQVVYGLKQIAYGKKQEPGYRRFRPLAVRIGVPQFASIDYQIGVGYYAWMQHVWELDPFTGLRWSVANINATEFGCLLG